jgi:hypothetical protein
MNPEKEFLTEASEITVFEQPRDFPSLGTVLAGMEILFGDYLTPDMFAPDLSPELALGWICKAYFDSRRNPKFNNPVGMVRRRLATKEPRKITRLQDMPADFLEGLGLWEGRCATCGQGFRSRSALSEHNLQGHPEELFDDEPEPEAAARPAQSPRVVDLSVFPGWESVLAQMQDQMPRASFETWVRDTGPVSWDAQAGRLEIGARNAYACEWLENRVLENCTELLGEIVGQPVKLVFVVV